MSIFGLYAKYYDLLYADKDYGAECRFVESLIRRHAPQTKEILELGCGTGIHACLLAERGFVLHGVDLSDEMLEGARKRVGGLDQSVRDRLSLSQGNVRDCKIGRSFDSIMSLFHVVSYQVSNADIISMFETVAGHLKKGGIFIFDYWFAPAVLTQKPSIRVRRIDSEDIHVTRIADPVLHPNQSCVDVNYDVFILDKSTGVTANLRETHRMRYILPTEIELVAHSVGLRVLESCEWLTGKQPGLDTWGVCAVLCK